MDEGKLVFWLELVFWNWEPGQDISMVMFPIPAPNHSNYVAVKARSAHSGQNPNVQPLADLTPNNDKDIKMWNFPSPLTLNTQKHCFTRVLRRRVRMGLSALEVDPTEEEKREESQLQRELQEKNFTDARNLNIGEMMDI